jgi:7-keto-8-aminopelargonate synthetase-like enzyme
MLQRSIYIITCIALCVNICIRGDTVLIAHDLADRNSDRYLRLHTLHSVIDKTSDHLANSIVNSGEAVGSRGLVAHQQQLDTLNEQLSQL